MFKPLRNNVIIKKLAEESKETKTKGGIILMSDDNNRERNDLGCIYAVSDDVTQVKKGDTVLYAKYAGTKYSEDGEEYLVICYDDILAVKC